MMSCAEDMNTRRANTHVLTLVMQVEEEQVEENKHLAFSLKNFPEYSNLNHQQKHDIDHALKTGKFNT